MKKAFLFITILFSVFNLHAKNTLEGGVHTLRGNINQQYTITTTGTLTGSVWGGANGIYTDDSHLGKAAVHAGLLAVGETGELSITILEGRMAYSGSNSHGVNSLDYGSYGGSFQFTIADAPRDMIAFRDKVGKVFTFSITGNSNGSVWGGDNGIYSDDSQLSAAAVHAGVVRSGQTAIVKVKVMKGMPSYKGNTKHGISSNAYGAWAGSYMFLAKESD